MGSIPIRIANFCGTISYMADCTRCNFPFAQVGIFRCKCINEQCYNYDSEYALSVSTVEAEPNLEPDDFLADDDTTPVMFSLDFGLGQDPALD